MGGVPSEPFGVLPGPRKDPEGLRTPFTIPIRVLGAPRPQVWYEASLVAKEYEYSLSVNGGSGLLEVPGGGPAGIRGSIFRAFFLR